VPGNRRRRTTPRLTFSFIYCKTANASAVLLSSPKALISELRAKILGFKPSAPMSLNALTA